MKKNNGLLKSVSICLVVALLMVGVGAFVLTGEDQVAQTGGKVEAAWDGQGFIENNTVEENGIHIAAVQEQEEEAAVQEQEEESEPAVVQTASAVVDNKEQHDESNEQEEKNQPVETVTEQPVAAPVPVEEKKVEVQTQPEVQATATSVPVTYRWGSTGNYTFRIEASVTNKGSEISRDVTVAVPLLENSSPYQQTSLKSVNYNIVSTSGRISTFDLGDIAPGETKIIKADFDIRINSVSINSSNEIVERARRAYEMYAGSGNCRTLALAFIKKSREMGINAREVIGYARLQRGAMTSGPLAGARHSWAEFEVPGLGWVPVDLTFQYFGELPHTSHIVEGYSDLPIKVDYTGGNLSVLWSNNIL